MKVVESREGNTMDCNTVTAEYATRDTQINVNLSNTVTAISSGSFRKGVAAYFHCHSRIQMQKPNPMAT